MSHFHIVMIPRNFFLKNCCKSFMKIQRTEGQSQYQAFFYFVKKSLLTVYFAHTLCVVVLCNTHNNHQSLFRELFQLSDSFNAKERCTL